MNSINWTDIEKWKAMNNTNDFSTVDYLCSSMQKYGNHADILIGFADLFWPDFVDIDGKHIIPPANGTVNINFPDEQRSGSTNLVFNIQGSLRCLFCQFLNFIGNYSEPFARFSSSGRFNCGIKCK